MPECWFFKPVELVGYFFIDRRYLQNLVIKSAANFLFCLISVYRCSGRISQRITFFHGPETALVAPVQIMKVTPTYRQAADVGQVPRAQRPRRWSQVPTSSKSLRKALIVRRFLALMSVNNQTVFYDIFTSIDGWLNRLQLKFHSRNVCIFGCAKSAPLFEIRSHRNGALPRNLR